MIFIPRDENQDVPWWERGNISAVPAPPGITSNLADPPSLVVWDVLTQSLCLSITSLLVAMRLYTKLKVLKNPGWDDYLSVLAWLGLIAMGVICLEQDRNGNGRHLWDITGYQYVAYAKFEYALSIVYNPTIFFTKASILILYLRVFNPVHRTFIVLHVVLWANFTFYFAATFVEAFQCMPIEKAWFPLLPGHCFDQIAGQTASAAINTFSDFVILVAPIANIWGLQLYKKGRLGLLLIFSFGIVACTFSIVRLVEFARKRSDVDGVLDVTWAYYSSSLVSVAEVTCGIICGCLPALPAFIRHISGIKMKFVVSSRDRNRSTLTSWVTPSTRPHLPNTALTSPASKSRKLSISAPSTPDLKQPPSSRSSPRSTERKACFIGTQHGYHHWDELDELEYVGGDDQRLVSKIPGFANDRSPRLGRW